jgi:hypothetical protein
MRALEFKAKIKDNQIVIPIRIRSKLKSRLDKDVRVLVLIEDDADLDDHLVFQQEAQNQFLEGYADADSIYDN